jgi:hypothetical protein
MNEIPADKLKRMVKLIEQCGIHRYFVINGVVEKWVHHGNRSKSAIAVEEPLAEFEQVLQDSREYHIDMISAVQDAETFLQRLRGHDKER